MGPAALSAGGYAELSIIDVVLSNPGAALPNLRGYPAGAFFGDRHHSLRLEYRLPIFFGEWAYYTLPLFFRHVQGNIFNDNSIIGFGDLQFEDWRSGIGAELIWIFYLGYNAPTTLRTGYARGLMEEGINEWYVRIGTAL